MLSNANTNLFNSLHCGTFLSRRGCCTILFDCWVLLHCSPPFCPPIHPPLSLAIAAVALMLLLLLILLLLLLILLLLFVLLQVLLLFVAAAVCCCCCCCTAAIVAALLSALPTHPWWCLNLIVVFVLSPYVLFLSLSPPYCCCHCHNPCRLFLLCQCHRLIVVLVVVLLQSIWLLCSEAALSRPHSPQTREAASSCPRLSSQTREAALSLSRQSQKR